MTEVLSLCRIEQLPEGTGKEFESDQGVRFFVVNHAGEFRAYLNLCPHLQWPLNMQPNVFFDIDRRWIQCSNHMALFEPLTGDCVSGPCFGAGLRPIGVVADAGILMVNEDEVNLLVR